MWTDPGWEDYRHQTKQRAEVGWLIHAQRGQTWVVDRSRARWLHILQTEERLTRVDRSRATWLHIYRGETDRVDRNRARWLHIQRRYWQGGQKQGKMTAYTDIGEIDSGQKQGKLTAYTDRDIGWVDRSKARWLHIQTEERLTGWTETGQDDCYTEERLEVWTEAQQDDCIWATLKRWHFHTPNTECVCNERMSVNGEKGFFFFKRKRTE